MCSRSRVRSRQVREIGPSREKKFMSRRSELVRVKALCEGRVRTRSQGREKWIGQRHNEWDRV